MLRGATLACFLGIPFLAWSQANPPVTDLGRDADLVAIATLERIVDDGPASPNLIVQLRVARTLKGQTPSATIFATIPSRPPKAPRPMSVAPRTLGKAGIWFLRSGSGGGYQILPRDRLFYQGPDLFLPLVESSGSTLPSGTLHQQLLAYHVRWFMSLQSPNTMEEFLFGASMRSWTDPSLTREEILEAVAPMIASPTPGHHILGLIAALGVGSVDAFNMVLDEIAVLRLDQRYNGIIDTIAAPLNKIDPSWLMPLRRLIAMRSDIPGLDYAAYGALAKLRVSHPDREKEPLMIRLLDTRDPNLPVTLARYFNFYELLASRHAEVTAPIARDFLKAWWAENHAKFGMPE